MGLIRKVASIMMLGGVSSHTRREPPGKAERARAKAERARGEPAGARRDTAPPRSPASRQENHRGNQEWRCRDLRAEAEAKVAEEQAAALARALHEDEAHGKRT